MDISDAVNDLAKDAKGMSKQQLAAAIQDLINTTAEQTAGNIYRGTDAAEQSDASDPYYPDGKLEAALNSIDLLKEEIKNWECYAESKGWRYEPLNAQSDAEPVAWRYRIKDITERHPWQFTMSIDHAAKHMKNPTYECERLYTAAPRPDASAGLIEALQQIIDNCDDNSAPQCRHDLALKFVREVVRAFAKAVLHGDDEHKTWLLEAADAFIAEKPLPAPRGKGTALAQSDAEPTPVKPQAIDWAYMTFCTTVERDEINPDGQTFREGFKRGVAWAKTQSDARICLSCDLSGECHAFDSAKQVCELCEHHEPLTVEAVNRAFKAYENRKAQSEAESHALELSEREKMLDERKIK